MLYLTESPSSNIRSSLSKEFILPDTRFYSGNPHSLSVNDVQRTKLIPTPYQEILFIVNKVIVVHNGLGKTDGLALAFCSARVSRSLTQGSTNWVEPLQGYGTVLVLTVSRYRFPVQTHISLLARSDQSVVDDQHTHSSRSVSTPDESINSL